MKGTWTIFLLFFSTTCCCTSSFIFTDNNKVKHEGTQEESGTLSRTKRGVLKPVPGLSTFRWPNATIPYIIWTTGTFKSFRANGTSYRLIKQAMRDIEEVSCVRFIEHVRATTLPRNTGYVIFVNGDSCITSPGYLGASATTVTLTANDENKPGFAHCMHRDTITHELLHVLGFLHEHQRLDRDKYVQIVKENIKADALEHFQIANNTHYQTADTLGAGYDRLSIMHYDAYAFSKNGEKTLIWKANESLPLGGKQMSSTDILQLNTYYSCGGDRYPTLPPTFIAKVQKKNHIFEKVRRFVRGAVTCASDICKKYNTKIIRIFVGNGFYADCVFGYNFGCSKCQDGKCKWKPNLQVPGKS